MGNFVVFLLCLVFVYTQVSWALPCHCGCEKHVEEIVKPVPVFNLGYAPLPKPEPYVYKGPPLPVLVKEPYPYIPPYIPVPAPIPEPCAGKQINPAPCCSISKPDKLALLKLALEHGKLHCDCKKLPLKALLCKHLLKKYELLCGCV